MGQTTTPYRLVKGKEASYSATTYKNDLYICTDTGEAYAAGVYIGRTKWKRNRILDTGTPNIEVYPWQVLSGMAGEPLQNDPFFASGNGGVSVYNNKSNGNVTVTRVSNDQNAPTASTHILRIQTVGEASPSHGGFVQSVQANANTRFMRVFLAKVPTGYYLTPAANSMGTNYTMTWLTENAGTGKWTWYAYTINCGLGGSYSTGGHVYVAGGTAPTAENPLTWYLAYCQTYNVSRPVVALHKGNFTDFVTPSAIGAAPSAHTHTVANLSNLHSDWATILLGAAPNQIKRWPTWSEVTGKPTTFAPAAHTHAWADVTGKPETATRWPSWSEVTGKPTTFAPSAHTHTVNQLSNLHADWRDVLIAAAPDTLKRWPTWNEVTGKPTTFTPSAHNQTVSTITDITAAWQTLLKAAPSAFVTRWPSWSEVTGKPTSFTPAAHTHLYAGSTTAGGPANSANLVNILDTRNDNLPQTSYTNKSVKWEFKSASKIGLDANTVGTYVPLLTVKPWSDAGSGGGYTRQIALSGEEGGIWYMRVAKSDTEWGAWRRKGQDNTAKYTDTTQADTGHWYKIRIKSTVAWMYYFRVRIYNAYRYFDIDISGYNYGSNHWHGPKANLVSSSEDKIDVTFGYTSDYNLWVCIPARMYRAIYVTDLLNGYRQDNRCEPFEITIVDAIPDTVQKTITCYRNVKIDEMATTSKSGLLSSADKTKLDTSVNKATWVTASRTLQLARNNGTTDISCVLPLATTSAAGLMSAAQVTALDGSVRSGSISGRTLTLTRNSGSQAVAIPAATASADGFMTTAQVAQLSTSVKDVTSLVGASDVTFTITKNSGAKETFGIAAASSSTAGLMLPAQKTKLDNLPTVSGGKIPVSYIPEGIPETSVGFSSKCMNGELSPLDLAIAQQFAGNRFAFFPADRSTFEYSRNSGATWTDYGVVDSYKIDFFSRISGFTAGNAPDTPGPANMLRVTMHYTNVLYAQIRKFFIRVSTNNAQGCYVTIEGLTNADSNAGNENWKVLVNKQTVTGWSGDNTINLNPTITLGGTSASFYAKLRFTFGYTGFNQGSGDHKGLNVLRIFAYGQECWLAPSTMAETGQIYSYNNAQEAIFPGAILPKTDGNYTLGSSTNRWKYVYATRYYGGLATSTIDGLMPASDKVKLDASLKSVTGAVTATEFTLTVTPNTGTAKTFGIVGATTTTAGLMLPADKTKLDGIAAGANKYVHPTSAAGAKASGLYKITTDATGHVTAAAAVVKADITALGIPATNTTYGVATTTTDGLMSKEMVAAFPSGVTSLSAVAGGKISYTTQGGTSKTVTLTAATASAAGIMSAADKSKLDGIAAWQTIPATNAVRYHRLATITDSGAISKANYVAIRLVGASGAAPAQVDIIGQIGSTRLGVSAFSMRSVTATYLQVGHKEDAAGKLEIWVKTGASSVQSSWYIEGGVGHAAAALTQSSDPGCTWVDVKTPTFA